MGKVVCPSRGVTDRIDRFYFAEPIGSFLTIMQERQPGDVELYTTRLVSASVPASTFESVVTIRYSFTSMDMVPKLLGHNEGWECMRQDGEGPWKKISRRPL